MSAVVLPAGYAQVPDDLSTEGIRMEYEKAWSSDQRTLESSIRMLHQKFAANLDKVQEQARERGDLDETLAARDLAAQVLALSSGQVFRVGGGVQQEYALPTAPGKGVYTPSGYTTYVARVESLLSDYNTAASNRYQQFLAVLDDRVREATRRDQIELALKIRTEREAKIAQGTPRMTLAGRKPVSTEAPGEGDTSRHRIFGTWSNESGRVRTFNRDRTVEGIMDGGRPIKVGNRVMLIDENRVDVLFDHGWTERVTLTDDNTISVISRHRSSPEPVRFTMQRAGGAPSGEQMKREEVGSRDEPVSPQAPDIDNARAPLELKDRFTGRWRFDQDVYEARVFMADGTVEHLRDNGKIAKKARYYKLDESEAEVAGNDGWIDAYKLNGDGTMKLTARYPGKPDIVLIGKRSAAP